MAPADSSEPPAVTDTTEPAPAKEPTSVVASSALPVHPYAGVIKDVIAVCPAIASVLYLFFLILYDEFYFHLGLHPDDVGLTQPVILARAAAGLVAVGGIVVVLELGVVVVIVFVWLINTFRSTDKSQDLRKNWHDHWLVRHLAIYPIPRFSDPTEWYPRRRWEILTFNAFLLVLLFSVALLWVFPIVKESGEDARRGNDVAPLTLLSGTILSIESRPCYALWLGSSPEPKQLHDPTLHCLGSANGTTLFRTSSETVRVPSSQVAITFYK